MRDIARSLGLSHVTVSLALSGNPRIPAARRAQIKSIADRLGYRPDPMLSALIQYRHGKRRTPIQASIAWLNFWPEPARLRSFGEFDGYWRGACAVAEVHGYRLEEFAISAKLPIERIQNILLARNVQGVLLPPVPTAGLVTSETMDWRNFSLVCFGYSHPQLAAHMVTADQAAAAQTALRSIRHRGYRRVGFVTTQQRIAHTMFSAGFLKAQLALPSEDRLPILIFDEATGSTHTGLLREWIAAHRPDAIITDIAALRDLLHTIGMRVPDDVGLAALSVLDGKADAGINQHAEEIGRVAAETVISLINHNHRGIPAFQRHILVEGFWVDGSTLPART
jgi:LacI family transcriptional regulator